MHYFVVDAFSAHAFGGNPAAVVVLEEKISDEKMQAIAKEFNLAETAFVFQQIDQQIDSQQTTGLWSLRWFTPTIEIDLCGHATLASAHVIWRELGNSADQLTFATLSGELYARRCGDKIELNFPSIAMDKITLDPDLLEQLQVSPLASYCTQHDLLLVLESEALVNAYQPDFSTIAQLNHRGLIITAEGGEEIDFVSRFFAPKLGIPEDPVTGAIHCALTPFWANKLNKQTLRAKQLSARGGELGLRLEDNKVYLLGDSITTMQGKLRL